jgi:hypothetical protein
MSAWYEHGYFSDDLEIAFGENSMFLPLKSFKNFNTGKVGSTSSQTPKYSNESGYP